MYASVDMERESHLAGAGEPRKGREQPPSPLAVSLVVAFIVAAVVGGFRPQPSASAAAESFVPEAFFAGLVLSLLGIYGSALVVGYMRVRQERERATQATLRQKTLEIEAQRAQDEMLVAYLDQVSHLLSNAPKILRISEMGNNLTTMLRARTLTLLKTLSGERKGSVVTFLYESGLIRIGYGGFTQYLVDSDLSRMKLSYAKLTGADLSRAYLVAADLSESNLSKANLQGANLTGTRLRLTSLRKTNLERSNLEGADLSGANLEEANLSEANLEEANLRGANLHIASLDGADLHGANLSVANLRGASLIRSNLRGANLYWADLSGADLREANLGRTGILVTTCKSLEGATMPNGQKYEDWLKDEENNGAS